MAETDDNIDNQTKNKTTESTQDQKPDTLGRLSTLIQTLSIVVGVVLSVSSFNQAKEKDIQARRIELAKPFNDLRQARYAEAIKMAGVLTNPDIHTPEEMSAAKKRFRELYIAELSMVESPDVAGHMFALAEKIDPQLTHMTEAQKAAYDLAHSLRDTFAAAYGVTP